MAPTLVAGDHLAPNDVDVAEKLTGSVLCDNSVDVRRLNGVQDKIRRS